jgi:hypothetical protein
MAVLVIGFVFPTTFASNSESSIFSLVAPTLLDNLAIRSAEASADSNRVYADFNGDGKDDLAIGVPLEDIGASEGAGAVNIIYGSTSGLTSEDNQFWNQDSSGIQGKAEDGDSFSRVAGYG